MTRSLSFPAFAVILILAETHNKKRPTGQSVFLTALFALKCALYRSNCPAAFCVSQQPRNTMKSAFAFKWRVPRQQPGHSGRNPSRLRPPHSVTQGTRHGKDHPVHPPPIRAPAGPPPPTDSRRKAPPHAVDVLSPHVQNRLSLHGFV